MILQERKAQSTSNAASPFISEGMLFFLSITLYEKEKTAQKMSGTREKRLHRMPVDYDPGFIYS